ncbi:MAG: phosphoribosylformimino-5-aminoimidazole carboxamide ribotide isomerase [Lentisphaeria bacterium]|nr:phosphoribosylformimino-5-aminoimidazole carboxamide ribotide isomerase [Lentisphaeria bacterium]
MRFRPCIDLHGGRVKQIVGSSLRDGAGAEENYVASESPGWFARKYHDDGLCGGHVIKLGPGNDDAAREALSACPNFLQIGGGITPENASEWIEAGASHVIVTSYLFADGDFVPQRLESLRRAVPRERLVLDLSCRNVDGEYVVACDRWQKLTHLTLSEKTFDYLGECCCEFLIHAVDVEGLKQGIDETLVARLAEWCHYPVTYAGGIRSLEDIQRIRTAGAGRIDFTVGSALDLFGGNLPYDILKRIE